MTDQVEFFGPVLDENTCIRVLKHIYPGYDSKIAVEQIGLVKEMLVRDPDKLIWREEGESEYPEGMKPTTPEKPMEEDKEKDKDKEDKKEEESEQKDEEVEEEEVEKKDDSAPAPAPSPETTPTEQYVPLPPVTDNPPPPPAPKSKNALRKQRKRMKQKIAKEAETPAPPAPPPPPPTLRFSDATLIPPLAPGAFVVNAECDDGRPTSSAAP